MCSTLTESTNWRFTDRCRLLSTDLLEQQMRPVQWPLMQRSWQAARTDSPVFLRDAAHEGTAREFTNHSLTLTVSVGGQLNAALYMAGESADEHKRSIDRPKRWEYTPKSHRLASARETHNAVCVTQSSVHSLNFSLVHYGKKILLQVSKV